MTTINLSTPSGGSTRPYVKLPEVGDFVTIAIAHVDKNVPERDYDTDEIRRWDDGNPITQTRIVGVVLDTGGTATGRISGEPTSLEVGQEVAIFVSGGKNGNQGRFKEAERNLGGIDLCDVMRYKFDSTEKASNPKWNDRKVHTTDLRKAKPEEIDRWAEQCAAIWQGFQDTPQVSSPAPAASHEDDPF